MSSLKLNYKKLGQGPPLIILHGLFGCLDNWQTIGNFLQNKWTVYLVDLRNHGRSPQDEEMSYPSMAEDIQHFLNDHHLDTSSIAGHSMGGKVVMQCLNNFPERFDKAMVIDIAPRQYKASHTSIFHALNGLELSQIYKRVEADEKLKTLIPELTTRQFILKNLDRTMDGSFIWKFNLEALQKNYSKICNAVEFDHLIPVPTAFLLGERSDYVNHFDVLDIKRFFSKPHFFTISNAGHWVHADNPKETMDVMSEFLIP